MNYLKMIPILLFSVFTACNASEVRTDSDSKTIASIPLVETPIEDETISESTPEYPLAFQSNSPSAIKMVRLGMTHGEEVPADFDKMDWLGLYQIDSVTAILKEVKPVKRMVFDALFDEDSSQQTGVQIDLENSEGLLILMNGPTYLKTGSLTTPFHVPTEIMVGQKERFKFKDKTYELHAEGIQDSLIDGWNGTSKYKLFLSEIVNEKTTHQTLLNSTLFFDEVGINILFMGDLDNDQKLDILLETANKYSYAAPAIYLSSFAERNQLVKIAGLSVFTSC